MNINPYRFSFNLRETENLRKMRNLKNGEKYLFFCPYYQPYSFRVDGKIQQNLAVERIRRIKKVKSEDVQLILNMIESCLNLFEHYHKINTFDCIIRIPSKANLTPLFFNKCCQRMDEDNALILPDLFIKNKFKDIMIDTSILDGENNEKTKSYVYSNLNHYKTNWSMREVEIKLITASIRRYFKNLFSFNPNINYEQIIKSKKLLLVDDTVGETKTFMEAINLIKRINKDCEIISIALVRDFVSPSKEVFTSMVNYGVEKISTN